MISHWLVVSFAAISCGGAAQTHPAALANDPLTKQIVALVAEPPVARAHWGVIVTSMDGTPLSGLNDAQLFLPASNTKLFTTAVALALLRGQTFETRLIGKGHFNDKETLIGDLILKGDGDANLSGRTLPYIAADRKRPGYPALRYLEEMANDVAKTGLKTITGDIVGDDTLFPWEPYAIEWAADDLVWGYGAPVSALTINDNQIRLTVIPAATAESLPSVMLDPAVAYYTLDASALKTGPAKSGSHIEIDRALGSKILRVYGSIAVDAKADEEEIAIADPAEYSAIALKAMLLARGIAVTGVARAEHRLPTDARPFLAKTREPIPTLAVSSVRGYNRLPDALPIYSCSDCDPKTLPPSTILASHRSATVGDDIVVTNKESQNLHAELLLHQLGAAVGSDGSTAQGARVVRQFLQNAGIDPADFVFYDGSGMSGHDLVTPRAIAKLLLFASTQPWFAEYKASLPIGGVDGTLESRFTRPPLRGHVFAKTGTHSEGRTLSGYLDCASGRTVIFSIMVGDHMPGSTADRDVMDRIVAAIAAAQ